MLTNIFTMYAVKVARRAMAISCLVAMTACRTTHHSSNTATTYAHTDSAITAALAQSHIDINDDIKIDIDEWHYFPIADSQQTAAPAPQSYRHVTVTRNISSKAATTDSIAMLVSIKRCFSFLNMMLTSQPAVHTPFRELSRWRYQPPKPLIFFVKMRCRPPHGDPRHHCRIPRPFQ